MTSPASTRHERIATRRTVLMCRPEFYTVSYRINPWMHPEDPTDTSLALTQWQTLHDLYASLGYRIELIDPLPGLPDMVYAANGGFTLDGMAYGARFQYPERGPEGPAYMDWFREHGFEVAEPVSVNEGRATSCSSATRSWRAPASAPTPAATTSCGASSAARS
ncbi:hypothetical protein GCM10025881_18640 [Pseudolysinimonas kribbensis]|uniref:Amidinotransferase n=1 Tax=Pseudolysinimonas kribbensis TaxID=433641 RepID=A0ABQ6K336_9MICO|nr:hypothetical protein GCM10025881_18640 [Pseudolysinimonas kribbensis]